jgi:hypothetical protein
MISHQILEIIAKTPDCREEHIYSGVFVDEHETHASLVALVAIGDIVASTREDGVTFYRFSEKFKASDAFRRLKMVQEVEHETPAGLPMVERAIAFVRQRQMQNRRATSSELHIVMELAPDALVSRYLADELERGVLAKDGKFWTLGAASLESAGLIDVVEVEAA